MESSNPGFISQLKGNPTKKCYRAATIFLDKHRDMTYVHLQQGFSLAYLVEVKKEFEAYTWKYSVSIKHYQSDNGRFVDNVF